MNKCDNCKRDSGYNKFGLCYDCTDKKKYTYCNYCNTKMCDTYHDNADLFAEYVCRCSKLHCHCEEKKMYKAIMTTRIFCHDCSVRTAYSIL